MGNERLRNRIYRRTAGWTIGGAMVVVAIMALSPSALGAHAATTLLPPYVGTSSHPANSLYANCGAASGTAAHWTGNNGLVTGAVKESYTDCPSWFGEPNADAGEWTTVAIPFHPTHVAEYNASLTWTYKITGSMSITGLACPAAINYTSGYDYEYCGATSEWFVAIGVSLYDITTLTTVSTTYSNWDLGNYTTAYQDNICYYGNCSSATGSYSGGGSYGYQAPGYDYGTNYLSSGTNAGSGSLWTNSTSWNPSTLSGTNVTLFPTHKYVVLVSVEYYAFGYEYRDSYVYTGSVSSYMSLNPAAGKGSSSVSGLSSGGSAAGIKLTSLTLTQV